MNGGNLFSGPHLRAGSTNVFHWKFKFLRNIVMPKWTNLKAWNLADDNIEVLQEHRENAYDSYAWELTYNKSSR